LRLRFDVWVFFLFFIGFFFFMVSDIMLSLAWLVGVAVVVELCL
jgi:hypothetical protein